MTLFTPAEISLICIYLHSLPPTSKTHSSVKTLLFLHNSQTFKSNSLCKTKTIKTNKTIFCFCGMASSLSFTSVCSFKSPHKPGIVIGNSVGGKVFRINEVFESTKTAKFQSLEVKATDSNQSTKPNSIVCAECDGNGAKLCTQCQGSGVNSVDHFNGQFKAGGLCWLCRGKREILCGNCNGAGFLGGFMSSIDD